MGMVFGLVPHGVAAWFGEKRPSYHLMLDTTLGTVLNPFTTKDEDLAYHVRDALNVAIEARAPAVLVVACSYALRPVVAPRNKL